MKAITKKFKSDSIKTMDSLLKTYYRIPECPRNNWRYVEALKMATEKINSAKFLCDMPQIKGAQWGGKWGNYYRMIKLNSKNEYQYVEGFNPTKYLN